MLHSSLGSGPLSSRAKRLRAVYWDTIGENEIRGALHRCFPASVNCPGQSAGAFFPRASLGRVQWKILPRAFPEGLRGHPTRREGKKPGALSLWSEGRSGKFEAMWARDDKHEAPRLPSTLVETGVESVGLICYEAKWFGAHIFTAFFQAL